MKKYKPVIWSIIVVLIFAVAYGFVVHYSFDSGSERGTFGDMFGGLSSLFTGFAFALLIYSMHLQKKELALQREEMELQREELRLTREEMKAAREEYSKSADAQEEMVEKQLMTAQITGMSAIVQGKYTMYSTAANLDYKPPQGLLDAEELLKQLLKDSGFDKIDMLGKLK